MYINLVIYCNIGSSEMGLFPWSVTVQTCYKAGVFGPRAKYMLWGISIAILLGVGTSTILGSVYSLLVRPPIAPPATVDLVEV